MLIPFHSTFRTSFGNVPRKRTLMRLARCISQISGASSSAKWREASRTFLSLEEDFPKTICGVASGKTMGFECERRSKALALALALTLSHLRRFKRLCVTFCRCKSPSLCKSAHKDRNTIVCNLYPLPLQVVRRISLLNVACTISSARSRKLVNFSMES